MLVCRLGDREEARRLHEHWREHGLAAMTGSVPLHRKLEEAWLE